MTQPPNLTPAAVYLHAFDKDQSYCEPDSPDVAGWCVYTRHEDEEEHAQFDLSDEQDFANHEIAHAEATARAARLGVQLRTY